MFSVPRFGQSEQIALASKATDGVGPTQEGFRRRIVAEDSIEATEM